MDDAVKKTEAKNEISVEFKINIEEMNNFLCLFCPKTKEIAFDILWKKVKRFLIKKLVIKPELITASSTQTCEPKHDFFNVFTRIFCG